MTATATRADTCAEFEQMITNVEAASILRVTTTTLGRLREAGQLPGYRVGNGWRYLPSDLRAFLAAGRSRPT